ncbi:MAG: DinB family protein [Reichenbachiella sp.]|uniref:DinB family protein n=1 Tax=Reichenbachiella sp. TaxID=2184521 RepID=UPI003263906C
MNDIDTMIECIRPNPQILSNLIKSIPRELLKTQRIFGKWSIQEHVCHLAQAEQMILNRFKDFKKLEKPHFKPYLPDEITPLSELSKQSIEEEIEEYMRLRGVLIDLLQSFDDSIWKKKAEHNEYMEYNAYILLRHTLMHDHFHMYRIEELWLTKQKYL